MFLFINGSLGVILIGIALGTLYTGGNFIKNDFNLSSWTLPTYGLEGALHPFNVALGLTLFFLARVQAELYFINNIAEETIIYKAKALFRDGFFFVAFL